MRKRFLCIATLAHVSCSLWAATGTGESYPTKPIRLILGFPPGGGDDYIARVIGPKLTDRFGQTVIVDNRPGAASTIAAEITARATPDGYTLFLGTSTALASSRSLYPKLGYDLLRDFSYISSVASGASVLLGHPSLPARTTSELVALARSTPKAVRYASGGVASSSHLAMELLISRTGMQLLHVPYKGAGPSLIALAGGEVQLLLVSVAAAGPMIKAKRLNALAVSSAKRVGALPEVPTLAESGVPGFDVTQQFGVFTPAGTPSAIVVLLNAETRNIVRMDDIKAKFAEQGLEPAGSTPEEWKAIMEAEVAQWARVIKDAHITAN